MKAYRNRVLVCLAGMAFVAQVEAGELQHFVFFGRDRERISESSFLTSDALVGAQLKYTWRELEPRKDTYAVDLILGDLEFLRSHGKQLFVQIQDVSFSEDIVNVPEYLRTDPKYNGGAELMLEFEDESETKPIPEGWVARRWDPAVRERFAMLLAALGRELDGKIAGINLPETSAGFGEGSRWHPKGYTFDSYRDGIKANMKAARGAFRRSVVLQYANFMPGEWLPWTDRGYLKSIFAYAAEIGVAVGGPDLLPFRKGQLNHSYPLIRNRPNGQIAGIAVQWGNYEHRSPETGRPVTIAQLHAFARDELALDYIFWCTQEPFYTESLLPHLRASAERNASSP